MRLPIVPMFADVFLKYYKENSKIIMVSFDIF